MVLMVMLDMVGFNSPNVMVILRRFECGIF